MQDNTSRHIVDMCCAVQCKRLGCVAVTDAPVAQHARLHAVAVFLFLFQRWLDIGNASWRRRTSLRARGRGHGALQCMLQGVPTGGVRASWSGQRAMQNEFRRLYHNGPVCRTPCAAAADGSRKMRERCVHTGYRTRRGCAAAAQALRRRHQGFADCAGFARVVLVLHVLGGIVAMWRCRACAACAVMSGTAAVCGAQWLEVAPPSYGTSPHPHAHECLHVDRVCMRAGGVWPGCSMHGLLVLWRSLEQCMVRQPVSSSRSWKSLAGPRGRCCCAVR